MAEYAALHLAGAVSIRLDELKTHLVERPHFRESLDRYAQPATAAAVTVHTAALGPRSEVMGAVAAALDRAARR